jgi:hypothetical protein
MAASVKLNLSVGWLRKVCSVSQKKSEHGNRCGMPGGGEGWPATTRMTRLDL